MTALRKMDFIASPSPEAGSRPGITLAVGSLAAIDQQTVRTMLHTLATRLSAYFRISDAVEAEVTLEANPADHTSFVLRAQKGDQKSELRLPRPLRLMPLADGLNAVIDTVRPQNLKRAAATATESMLGAAIAEAGMRSAIRLTGAWGQCASMPGHEDVAFDRPLVVVARALAEDARVQQCETISAQIAETLHASARTLLRPEEVVWLSGSSAEFQRAVAVKLAHPDAFLKLSVWPNLARLPEHRRWIGVFARLQRGASMAAAIEAAAIEGLSEAHARRGIYMLLQSGQMSITLRPATEAKPVEPSSIPSPSFMQRLRSRLRQLVEG